MTRPLVQEVQAPAAWRAVDFISDLHLQAAEPATFDAWRRFMASTDADAVFILGDLFEVWVGDDAARVPGFAADCAAVLREAGARIAVYFLHGNRDFLVGHDMLDAAGVTLLADPAVLQFGGARWLLSHGDALCLGDLSYLRFRDEVRQGDWQRKFLARPLAERLQIAQGLRGQSEARKRMQETYADVDTPAALEWLASARATTMIHGHTHRPGEHLLDAMHRRLVLSDWDAQADPPRLQALRLHADGVPERRALA